MAGELGFGATLAYADALGGSYTALSRIVDIIPHQQVATRVDRRHHGMSAAWIEKSAGLVDAGEIEVVVESAKAVTTALFALVRTDKYWRIQWPLISGETTPTMWRCAGFLADITDGVPIDDRMTTTIKIVLSGKPTFTEGS